MLPMKTIKEFLFGCIFDPLLWSLMTILCLFAQQYFVAALFCSVAIYMLITKTVPLMLTEVARHEIMDGHFSQAQKLARFGIDWCNIFFIGPTRSLPRSIAFDQMFKDQLATALMVQGNFADSIKLDRESLGELEMKGDTAGAANVRNSLALCCCWLGDFAEAEHLIQSSIIVLENLERNAVQSGDVIKDVHTSRLAYAFHVRATISEKKRDYDAADVFAEKAIETIKKLFDENTFEMTSHFVLRGTILMRLNRYGDAETFLTKAYGIRHALLPPGHPLLSSVDKEIGRLYCETGRLDLAEPLLRSALQSLLTLAKDVHPDLPEFKGDLAKLLIKKKDFAEAEKLLTSALEQREQQSNANHPDLIDLLVSLSEVASANGDECKAETLTARAQSILAQLKN